MGFQIGSTLLDACVLSFLSKGETYGYVLTQAMKEALDLSESTLYPVLRRLQKSGFLRTYDKPYQGRNRRYYVITDDGKRMQQDYIIQWREFRSKIDEIITGGADNEKR